MSKNNKVKIQYDKEYYDDDRSNYDSIVQDESQINETENKITSGAYASLKEEINELESGTQEDLLNMNRNRISTRETDYHKKRYRPLSPARHDPLKDFNSSNTRTYKDIMLEQKILNEKNDLIRQTKKNQDINSGIKDKKMRLDSDVMSVKSETSNATKLTNTMDWDSLEKTEKEKKGPGMSKWDTPTRKRRWGMTPVGGETPEGKDIY
jgi:hypothetical protein